MRPCPCSAGAARHRWWFLLPVLVLAGVARGGPVFRVTFDKALREQPASGRLIVYLVKAGSPVDLGGKEPGEGPFFESPQPLFGIDVQDLAPGKAAVVDDSATSFPAKLSELAAGRYKVQAVLDMAQADSSWQREPGNLYSRPQMVELKGPGPEAFDIRLSECVKAHTDAPFKGCEYFEVRSELLTRFRGHEVMLKAGVVLPNDYDPKAGRKYGAVYEIPGFGGDHTGARMVAAMRRSGAYGELMKECFWITLNPEGPNGHHLFANSENNGPVGDALVKELIPALEAKYALIGEASARLLRGHSSGGWSTVWLAITYPETFGAAWSTSPDPVDFTHFQLPDIYSDASMYTGYRDSGARGDGAKEVETPSFRDTGAARMTIRQENRMEEVLGPRNTSGQQWDSWLAVFGPKAKDGKPADLYDPQTGKLDHAVAQSFRRYDVTDLLRKDPGKYGLIFKQRIRLVVGDQDNYYLNEAVASLKAELEKLSFLQFPEGEHGYVKIVPGRDHRTIIMSRELQAIPGEMLEHLRLHRHAGK